MNLILLGNGFDKAHGLNTLYSEFVDHVVGEHLKDRGRYKELLDLPKKIMDRQHANRHVSSIIGIKNALFRQLFLQSLDNWCDIEEVYFSNILSIDEKAMSVRNEEFDAIKKSFYKYLESQVADVPMKGFTELFRLLSGRGQNIALNFNYTNTGSLYFGETSLISIHGELDSDYNPPIFGYAPKDEDSDKLLNKGDAYIQNIKEFNYDRTNNYNWLVSLMNKANQKFDLFLIGHSCGLSDRMILSDIFGHENLRHIYVLYYENYTNYREVVSNIARISGRKLKRDKVVNFASCLRCPQLEEDVDPLILDEFVGNVFGRRRIEQVAI